MYKVFIENTPVWFQKNQEISTNTASLLPFLPILKLTAYNDFVKAIKLAKKQIHISTTVDAPQKDKFFSLFRYIEAAGGLVYHTKNKEFLFIKRNGCWDIPKGKIEKNESAEIAAIREVEEECGIKNIQLKNHLTVTFHTYTMNNIHYLKKTYWYFMEYDGSDELVPQLEENITIAKWFSKNNWDVIKQNTYESIIDVLNCYDEKL